MVHLLDCWHPHMQYRYRFHIMCRFGLKNSKYNTNNHCHFYRDNNGNILPLKMKEKQYKWDQFKDSNHLIQPKKIICTDWVHLPAD